jgi:hypothetical protein
MRKISAEQRQANHNKYQQEYRKKNPERVAQWRLNHYKKKLAQYAAKNQSTSGG